MTTTGYSASAWIWRDERDPLRTITPNRLHAILAGKTEWTDELFEEATSYLSGKLSMVSMGTLAAFISDADVLLPEDSHQLRTELFKRAQMRIYRRYPPSMLLGFYDLARTHGLFRED